MKRKDLGPPVAKTDLRRPKGLHVGQGRDGLRKRDVIPKGNDPDVRFGDEIFRRILTRALDKGYRFSRFDEVGENGAVSGGPLFYLRHDVDISPPMAIHLGRIEHEHGVKANFFFQINAETYSLFVPETLDIIRDLRAMGHCVGLHIDEQLIGADEQAIEQTFDWLLHRIIDVDRAVSFHRPSREVLGRRYARFVNAYDDRVFDGGSYLSDSRRSLAFHETLEAWLDEGKPHIQLLLHPEWWCEVNSLDQLWGMLSDRRTDQLSRYMLKNFPKVFNGLLHDGDRIFPI